MTDTLDKAPAPSVPPEQIKAIPVRHYGRWVAGAVVVAIVALLGVAFSNAKINYGVIPDYVFDKGIMEGAWTTLYISVLAMVLGVALGIVLAVMRLSSNPVTSTVSWFYIWFFRGTPVLVQLLLWYNISLVFPILNLGFYKNEMTQVMTPVLTALLGLGLNEAAYMSEIVRAGIQSVDEGQTEASHALGMTQGQTLRRVILPQAMRVIIPPTGNEFINMLKTSALAYAVQLPELIKTVTDISSASLAVVEMYFVACVWYLFLTTIFSIGQYYIERRYARGSSRNLPPTPLQKIRANMTKMNLLSLSNWRR
ncbi:amino acid ABC transporter permease [Streptomyces coacervatus]|uniref:Amino acid ABC transporter permease n=1 Tax=Streptomyces coacervatus TaxID=647381 RepID=A0ABP7J292_9ACTN|nr:amino acid ABC transporter permease [Streptomyces coacervatus]MDF2272927.1 amino acid ABC transporter permease [Streptomyces coacervatus]